MMRRLALLALLLAVPACRGETPTRQPTPPTKLGVNLDGVTYWSPAWVFVDAFNMAGAWIPQRVDGGPWDTGESLALTSEGWVARLAPGQAAGTLMRRDHGGRYPAGRYVCTYAGRGDIEFHFDAKVVSRSPGRIELDVTPSDAGIYLKLAATDPNDPVRNIRVLMPGFADADDDLIFHPRFLASLKPFEVLRFMDWQRTNGSPLAMWAKRPTPKTYVQTTAHGVALEYMLALCNQTQKHAWLCVPHQFDDASVSAMAKMVRDELDPNLHVYIEHSNEVWNMQFEQAQFAQQRGIALGLSAHPGEARLRYHAQRSAEIFKIWRRVFTYDAERLICVLSGQHGNEWAARQILDWRDAAETADAFAIAPYFGGRFGGPDQVDATRALGVDGLLDACATDAREQVAAVKRLKTIVDRYGLPLIAYEAGQHLAGRGGAENAAPLNALFDAANRHPRMQAIYAEYLRGWYAAAEGGLLMHFSHIGRYTKWGRWGLLEHQDADPAAAPKWRAIVNYAKTLRRSPAPSR